MMSGKLIPALITLRSRLKASSALAAGFVFILLVTSMIGIAVSASLARRMEAEVTARNKLLAVTLAKDMSTFLDGYLQALHLASSGSFWSQEATGALSRLFPAFRSVLLVNTAGQVEFASSPSWERFFEASTREYFIASMGTGLPYLSPTFIAEDDLAPTAVMAVSGSKGSAVAYLNLEAIGKYIQELPVQGSETIAIVDQHGYYFAHQDTRLVLERSSVVLDGWYQNDAHRVAGGRLVWKPGEPQRLVCWTPVQGFSGWTVMVSEEADDVLAQSRTLRLSVLASVITSSLTALIFIVFILRILDHDIGSLYSHVAAVAGGNYDTVLHYQGFKDLAPLANSYREAVAAVRDREQRIQENERRLEGILDFMPIPVIIMDRQESVFHINHSVTRTFGWALGDLPDLSTWWLRMYPDEAIRSMAQEHWAGHLALLYEGRIPPDHFEGELACQDGSTKKVIGGTAVFGDWIVLNFVDVSESKDAEARMAANLKEKEVLLKEIHHRVKNNLQLIISLLNLKSQASGTVDSAFTESIDRVRVMATIHELLYESHDFSHIDLGEYIRTIVDWIMASYAYGPLIPQLSLELQAIDLDIDSAVPCGLIINELFTNAIKYAFDATTSEPAIHILSRTTSDGFIELVFADNGKGLPLDIEPRAVKSLGFQLIVSLSDQLRGSWHLSRDGGTSWTIRFPVGRRES
ncbi:MAG: histidine kinase dimerization/phosphoacceptor domain -containing protein [Spirochaetia bacterium]|nr:histidine kinase dimerization/phosphoacceptor domain -containing protein [Spirochaetia bacterium]